MEADQPGEVAVKAEGDAQPEGRMLKRKKTVTWADDDLELPLGPSPPAAERGGAAGAASASAAAAEAAPAVVVLPCDGLYDSLSADLLQQQVGTPPQQAEALSRRQLLERRLHHTQQLAELYEAELWSLLEELRLRHTQFAQQPGVGVWKAGAAGAGSEPAAAVAAAEGGAEPPPKQQKRRRQAEGKSAPSAAAAAAAQPAPSSLRQLWEQQQQPQQQQQVQEAGSSRPQDVAQPPAAGGAGQQQAAPAAAPPASCAGSPPPLPRLEEVEGLIISGAAAQLGPVDEGALLAQRQRFVQHLSLVGRLEQSALAATCRELDALGGLALLCGRRCRYVLRRAAVCIGRNTESQGKVDVDLALEGSAQRVSRQQAQLFLDPDGAFRLRCTGRRAMLVNGRPVAQGQQAVLPSLSHIRVGDVSLLFVANNAAAQRAVQRSAALLTA